MGIPRSHISRGPSARCLLLVLLNGCFTNWQVQEAAPQQVIESTGEPEVRVTLNSGINVVLRDPGVEGDSLIGWQQPADDSAGAPARRQAFALGDVRTVSVRKSNTGANIAAGALIGAAAFVASVVGVLLIVCGASSCD